MNRSLYFLLVWPYTPHFKYRIMFDNYIILNLNRFGKDGEEEFTRDAPKIWKWVLWWERVHLWGVLRAIDNSSPRLPQKVVSSQGWDYPSYSPHQEGEEKKIVQPWRTVFKIAPSTILPLPLPLRHSIPILQDQLGTLETKWLLYKNGTISFFDCRRPSPKDWIAMQKLWLTPEEGDLHRCGSAGGSLHGTSGKPTGPIHTRCPQRVRVENGSRKRIHVFSFAHWWPPHWHPATSCSSSVIRLTKTEGRTRAIPQLRNGGFNF